MRVCLTRVQRRRRRLRCESRRLHPRRSVGGGRSLRGGDWPTQPDYGQRDGSGGSQGDNANPPPVTSGPPPAVSPAPVCPDRRRRPVVQPVRPRPVPPEPQAGRWHTALTPFVASSDMTVPAAALQQRHDRYHRDGRQRHRLHDHHDRLVQNFSASLAPDSNSRPELSRDVLLHLRRPDRPGGDRRCVGPRLGRVGLHLRRQQRQRQLRLHH